MSAIASGLAASTATNTARAAAKTNATATNAKNGFGSLDSSEFTKIILSELSNQDPFKPNDTQALLEQLSSLRNIESQTSLQDSLEKLVLQNSLSQAGSLIGKIVEGVDANTDKVTGKVTSVRVTNGEPTLQLDTGRQVKMTAVSLITSDTQ